MTWLLWLASIVCLLALAAVGLSAWGERRWSTAIKLLQRDLAAGRTDDAPLWPPAPTHCDERELEGLRAPVQRYFRAALKNGQPLFLWNASIAMLPGMQVRVVDSYIAGKGLLQATVQGLLTVANMGGDGEIARGEFMRWFAEVAWYPSALLSSQGVQWRAVDAHSAQATVQDGPLTLSLLFRFNEAGLIGSFRAEARGGMVGNKLVMAPWEGAWSNYQTRDGMQVPFTGQVAWMRPEGRKPYFIGTVTALTFEFAPRRNGLLQSGLPSATLKASSLAS